MNQKILNAITTIFREVFDDPALVLTKELSANDVENWDSLNHITLIVELETLTGLSLSTDELVNLKDVGDFAQLLADKGYRG
jgi:acyl carrier protein